MKNKANKLEKRNAFILGFLLCLSIVILFAACSIYYNLDSDNRNKYLLEIGKQISQLFFILLIGGLIKFYLDEHANRRAELQKEIERDREKRIAEQIAPAYLVQLRNANKAIDSDNVDDAMEAIIVLTELGRLYPHRWQSIIDIIRNFLRRKFIYDFDTSSAEQVRTPNNRKLLQHALLELSSVPHDTAVVDLSELYIAGAKDDWLDLKGFDFSRVKLWGSYFQYVHLSGSNFGKADVAGTVFHQCGMDDCNFKDAEFGQSAFGLSKDRPTSFIECGICNSNIADGRLPEEWGRPLILLQQCKGWNDKRINALNEKGFIRLA